jgi:hypothetical protein
VRRKNVEAMALRLLGAGPDAARRVRALQQFIGEGAWDDDALLAEHQRLVAASLGEPDGGAHPGWQRRPQAGRPRGRGSAAMVWRHRQD